MDAIFEAFYAEALKAAGTPGLTDVQTQEVVSKFKKYLGSKYASIADEITYRFMVRKFEPEAMKLSTPLTLAQNVTEYKFTDYKQLFDTLLVDFCIPIYNSLTTFMGQQTILDAANLAGAFVTLINDRQQNVVYQEPLVDYFRDTAYWQGKGKLAFARMDWDNSKIEFPSNTIPNANVGKVILPVVTYIDMKRYPYLDAVRRP